jgi:hypothetical protein
MEVTGGRIHNEEDVFMDQDRIYRTKKDERGAVFVNGQLLTVEPKY